jgi:hypothetical protein
MEGGTRTCDTSSETLGLADYLGWKWRSLLGLPVINIPGCPVQPDNFTETLLYLLYQVVGLAPMQRYAATPVRLGTLQSSPDTQEPLPSPRKLAGRLATSGRCTHRGPTSRLSVDRLSLTRVTGAPRKPLKLIREGKKITERYQNNPVLAENTHAGIDSHLLEVGQNNNGNGYGVGIQQTRDE